MAPIQDSSGCYEAWFRPSILACTHISLAPGLWWMAVWSWVPLFTHPEQETAALPKVIFPHQTARVLWLVGQGLSRSRLHASKQGDSQEPSQLQGSSRKWMWLLGQFHHSLTLPPLPPKVLALTALPMSFLHGSLQFRVLFFSFWEPLLRQLFVVT